jgi:hypothetical protein
MRPSFGSVRALASVPAMYSSPNCPCDRPYSLRISPAESEMKKVCPKDEKKVRR